ncbi:hypothetical protein BJX99DRAFT_251883 [Aspergillus californicus]
MQQINSCDTLCAALDKGGGVRFGPNTFAIYSCAPLPQSFNHLRKNVALYTKLTTAASRVCKTLSVHVNLDLNDPATAAQLSSLEVPPAQAQRPVNTIYHLPWFLINAAALETHCVIGNGSAVEALLVILQRPWCVLEICCTDTKTVVAVKEFARIAGSAQGDPESYDTAVRLLTHEIKLRKYPGLGDIGTDAGTSTDSRLNNLRSQSRCSVKALCDMYASTTLIHSYNRFWLPLICSCAVYLGVPFSEVVRRIRRDLCDGPEPGLEETGRVDWIVLYRELLGKIGDWMT